MEPAEIELQLARPVNAKAPQTVADLLTMIFDDDWQVRKTVIEGCGDYVRLRLRLTFDVPMPVAKAHLTRMMEMEAKGLRHVQSD